MDKDELAERIPPEVVEAPPMKDDARLPIDVFKQLLNYDPETGLLTWKEPQKNGSMPAGSVAGSVAYTGYVKVQIKRKMYMAHRIAWLLTHGEWPSGFLDHIDNCRSNNRIANLRVVNAAQNSRNALMSSANTSGYKGVTWSKKSQKWQASVKVQGRSNHVGLFGTKELAAEAAQNARNRYHGDFANHGLPLPEVKP